MSLYAAIKTRFSAAHTTGFLLSWALLVLPMLLAMTAAAEKPFYLVVGLIIPLGIVLQMDRTEPGNSLPSTVPPSPSQPHKTISRPKMPPLPALTTYRAHMMLMTVLSILAVDFPVFPRSLAKCETFGVSLVSSVSRIHTDLTDLEQMDLGVGSFVFSQGIVSAIPLVRDPRYLTGPLLPKLFNVTRKCLPIIALGVVRVLLVKGTEYPVSYLQTTLSTNIQQHCRNTLRNTASIGTSSSRSLSYPSFKFCYTLCSPCSQYQRLPSLWD